MRVLFRYRLTLREREPQTQNAHPLPLCSESSWRRRAMPAPQVACLSSGNPDENLSRARGTDDTAGPFCLLSSSSTGDRPRCSLSTTTTMTSTFSFLSLCAMRRGTGFPYCDLSIFHCARHDLLSRFRCLYGPSAQSPRPQLIAAPLAPIRTRLRSLTAHDPAESPGLFAPRRTSVATTGPPRTHCNNNNNHLQRTTTTRT